MWLFRGLWWIDFAMHIQVTKTQWILSISNQQCAWASWCWLWMANDIWVFDNSTCWHGEIGIKFALYASRCSRRARSYRAYQAINPDHGQAVTGFDYVDCPSRFPILLFMDWMWTWVSILSLTRTRTHHAPLDVLSARAIDKRRSVALAHLQTSTPKLIVTLHGLLSFFHLIQVPSQAAHISIATYHTLSHTQNNPFPSHYDISAAITRTYLPHLDELEHWMTFDHIIPQFRRNHFDWAIPYSNLQSPSDRPNHQLLFYIPKMSVA